MFDSKIRLDPILHESEYTEKTLKYVNIGNTAFIVFYFWCFNATVSNISAISWRPVLVVEEARVPGEKH